MQATDIKYALTKQAEQAGEAANRKAQIEQEAKGAAEQQARFEQQARHFRQAGDTKSALEKEAAAQEAAATKAEMEKQAAFMRQQCETYVKSMQQLTKQLEERDIAISERDQALQKASKKWEQAVQSMAHASMSQQELLQQRRAMRAKLLPLPEMEPDDWHITVVMGPAGLGKSSFVLELLISLGYSGAPTRPCCSSVSQYLHGYACFGLCDSFLALDP
jgi:flagellar biosynthesis GTPase FlhF